MIKVYTDGSCRGNGTENAAGAFGFIVVDDEGTISKTFTIPDKDTTNQREELKAVISACNEVSCNTFEDIYIYTDSAYIYNAYSQKWYEKWQNNGWLTSKNKPVANRDLWEQLLPYFNYANYHFIKVKGHDDGLTSDSYYNNIIDNLVQQTSLEFKNVKTK